jgi:hypothetical protein
MVPSLSSPRTTHAPTSGSHLGASPPDHRNGRTRTLCGLSKHNRSLSIHRLFTHQQVIFIRCNGPRSWPWTRQPHAQDGNKSARRWRSGGGGLALRCVLRGMIWRFPAWSCKCQEEGGGHADGPVDKKDKLVGAITFWLLLLRYGSWELVALVYWVKLNLEIPKHVHLSEFLFRLPT